MANYFDIEAWFWTQHRWWSLGPLLRTHISSLEYRSRVGLSSRLRDLSLRMAWKGLVERISSMYAVRLLLRRPSKYCSAWLAEAQEYVPTTLGQCGANEVVL